MSATYRLYAIDSFGTNLAVRVPLGASKANSPHSVGNQIISVDLNRRQQ